jgi:hypothetical protein
MLGEKWPSLFLSLSLLHQNDQKKNSQPNEQKKKQKLLSKIARFYSK